MTSCNNIFPSANNIRNDGRTFLIIHNEIRSIENAILFATDNGVLDAIVFNTFMTDTELETFQDITFVNSTTNELTKNGHQLQAGDEIQFATTDTLPTPIILGQTFYIIVVDSNVFKIAASFSDAVNNVEVDITDIGAGTHSFRKLIPAQQFYKTWKKTRSDRSQINQMNAVLKYFTDLGYSIKRKTNPNVTGSSVFRWEISW